MNNLLRGDSVSLWKIHGLNQFPPIPCPLKLNDRVLVTDDCGETSTKFIIGFDDSVDQFVHACSEDGSWSGSGAWLRYSPDQLSVI